MHIDSFKAENNYLIIELNKHEVTTKLDSGLIMVEKTKWDDLMSGIVKVLSDTVKLPKDVSTGTTVFFFEKDIKSRFHMNAIEYLAIKDIDLLAFR